MPSPPAIRIGSVRIRASRERIGLDGFPRLLADRLAERLGEHVSVASAARIARLRIRVSNARLDSPISLERIVDEIVAQLGGRL